MPTVEAFVAQKSKGDTYFASVKGSREPVRIQHRYCPTYVDILGKWVRVSVDNHYNANGPVEIVSDRFPSRVLRGIAEVKVDLVHDGISENNIHMYRSDYFGLVCDSERVLHNPINGRVYSAWIIRHKEPNLVSRWRLSIKQDALELDNHSVSKTNSETSESVHGNNTRLARLTGVVTGYSQHLKYFLVFSKDRPRSTMCLDEFLCPKKDMLGRWIEVEVDSSQRVQKPVRILNDFCECRIKSNRPEFRVDFQHSHRFKKDFHIYRHEYFGEISDYEIVIDNVKEGAWYSGWVVYQQVPSAGTCWIISVFQQITGPIENPNRPRSSTNDSRERYRSRSPTRERGRSSSPEIFNEYDEEQDDRREDPFERKRESASNLHGSQTESSGDGMSRTSSSNAFKESAKAVDVDSSAKEKRRLKHKLNKMSRLIKSFTATEEIATAMKLYNLENYEELLELANQAID